MQTLVISILGKDKPGIVDALAKVIFQHQGNWHGSSFAHMSGLFTGFVEIQVPSEQKQALIDGLDAITDLSVQSVVVSEPSPSPSQKQSLTIDVMGNDRPGIVQALTQVLNRFNLNILHFASHVESAANSGSPMFKAKVDIAVPDTFDNDALQVSLEALANEIVVDISYAH